MSNTTNFKPMPAAMKAVFDDEETNDSIRDLYNKANAELDIIRWCVSNNVIPDWMVTDEDTPNFGFDCLADSISCKLEAMQRIYFKKLKENADAAKCEKPTNDDLK